MECEEPDVSFPLVISKQRVSPKLWLFETIHNTVNFYSDELLAPCPTSKLDDQLSYWLCSTAYSMYSQLVSILETVPPSTTC